MTGRINRNSTTVKSSLNNNEVRKKERTNMAKKLQTLYEYFNGYLKEQINEMISKLTDEERNLIELRYGNDLENPVTSESWGKEDTNKFYGSLISKMKRLLVNPEGKRKKYVRKNRGFN